MATINPSNTPTGASGTILQGAGIAVAPTFSTATYPSTTTINQLLYSSSANIVAGLATVNGGVLVTGSSGIPSLLANPSATGKALLSVIGDAPAWSTPTYPSASGTSGTVLRSDGTNNVYSTFTIPNTYAQGDLLYASLANTLTALAKDANATRYLSNTGTTNNPAWAQVNLANGVTGNLAVTNLNSGTNASATTYWRGDTAWATISGSDITGAALSKVDDTNVTLTLGGAPTTALLRAASITAGWTGTLAYSRGGLGAAITADNGAIFYSTASNAALLASTATARQMLQSGASAAPAWSTATYPATTVVSEILYSSSTNTVTGLATTNRASLSTNSTGVPTWLALTNGQLVIGSTAGSPAAGTLTAGLNTTVTNASNSITVTANLQTHVMEFRLSGSATLPIAGGTALTTLYMTPYTGNQIALYDGSTGWNIRSSSGASIAVPATTSTLYDVFCYDNAGTPTLELLAWTNDTTRATALITQDGTLVKTGDTTRRWIGCMRTTAVSGQTQEDASFRLIYNFYNQILKNLNTAPVDGTWTWSGTYGSWRAANANITTNQIGVIAGAPSGYQSYPISITYQILTKSGGTSVTVIIGISKDGVDPNAARGFGSSLSATASPATATYYPVGNEAAGYHYFLPYEYLNGSTDTVTFSKTVGIVVGSFRGWCLG